MRRACRVESLDQQVQQYRTVLADRIHHHRILEPGDNLAEDVDAFRLEAVEVAWGGRAHLLHSALNVGPAAHCTCAFRPRRNVRSEEHTSELQSLMRISYAVFCLKKKTQQ